MATVEIPAPIHYPPVPAYDIDVFDFTHDSDESEEEATPISTPYLPSTPLPPRAPARHLEYGPNQLPASFSFACVGWLQFYMFGVGKCLKEHGLHSRARFAGCSAGALTALGLCVEASNFDKAVVSHSPSSDVSLSFLLATDFTVASPQEYCKTVCIPRCRGTLLGPFLIHKYVQGCLQYSGSLDEHWTQAKDRLHVTVTNLPDFRSVRVTEFESKDDLISALLASSAAFPLAPPVKRRGKWLIDGGISDFQPIFETKTVTVNPFYFSQVMHVTCYMTPWEYVC